MELLEGEFKTYLRLQYDMIADQALEIEKISIIDEDYMHSVNIRLTENGADIFKNQTERAAYDYTLALLRDAIAYFAATEVLVDVEEMWITHSAEDAAYWTIECPEWCYVGDYSSTIDGWRVYYSYANGFYFDQEESIEVWNYK